MPEDDVLEPGDEVAAQQPGDADEAFRGDRVPLVRHRRGPFLARDESLRDLGHLASLEVAELGRDRLDRRSRRRERVEKLGVAVAGDHLVRRRRRQAERRAHVCLDEGIDVRVGAHRAGEFAHRHGVTGLFQSDAVAIGLQTEKGQLRPERRRLGVHAVGAPDDRY